MEKISELLKQLATQLGTTVEYLWSVLLKQAQVELRLSYIAFTISIVVLIGGVLFGLKLLSEKKKSYSLFYAKYPEGKDKYGDYRDFSTYGDSDFLWWIIPIVVCFVVGFAMFGVNLTSIIQLTYNPEYYALNKVLSLLK